MFKTSTHRNKWLFAGKEVLDEKRKKALNQYIQRFRGDRPDAEIKLHFLTDDEEQKVQAFFEVRLKEFCSTFDPKLPKNVVECAIHYYKRFYLKYTAMDYHPKEIGYLCLYFASKIEEFNLSLPRFMHNVPGYGDERAKIEEFIRDHEMLLMDAMNFQFKIYISFESMEGYIDNIKANRNDLQLNLEVTEIDSLQPHAERFLEYALLSDVLLIYTPQQVALAALLHGTTRINKNGELDVYLSKTIARNDPAHLGVLTRAIKRIRQYVNRRMREPEIQTLGYIEPKMNLCQNQANNIGSKEYKRPGEDEDSDSGF